MNDRWQPTSWLLSSTCISAGLLVTALILRRSDVLILAFGPLAITIWSLATRPAGAPTLETAEAPSTAMVGEDYSHDLVGHDLVGAEQWYARWAPKTGIHWQHGVLGGMVHANEARLAAPWSAVRVGQFAIGAASTMVLSPWAAYRVGPLALPGAEVRVRPMRGHSGGRLEVPHPIGLVGGNRSTSRGSGTEFADIRPYRAGDSLRSIDWARTARNGDLHVRDNYAEQDAAVLVALDGSGGGPSWQRSLQCAASAAEFFVRHGDRVGLVTLNTGRPTYLPYRSGRRQYDKIADVLSTLSEPEAGDLPRRVRLPIPAGGIVLLVSSLLTDVAPSVAMGLAQRGVQLIILDTAPARGDDFYRTPPGAEQADQIASRLRLLERRTLVEQLISSGAQITAWHGASSLELPLRQLARRPPPRVAAR